MARKEKPIPVEMEQVTSNQKNRDLVNSIEEVDVILLLLYLAISNHLMMIVKLI